RIPRDRSASRMSLAPRPEDPASKDNTISRRSAGPRGRAGGESRRGPRLGMGGSVVGSIGSPPARAAAGGGRSEWDRRGDRRGKGADAIGRRRTDVLESEVAALGERGCNEAPFGKEEDGRSGRGHSFDPRAPGRVGGDGLDARPDRGSRLRERRRRVQLVELRDDSKSEKGRRSKS